MIELQIVETGKGYSSKERYKSFNEFSKCFQNMTSADDYLKERYGKCKKQKMYVDTKEGQNKHVGYIFCFKNSDISHFPVDKWLQQDWVSFYKCEEIVLTN